VLRVEGPRAIEVQHRSGPILERVNTYFGYRAVAETQPAKPWFAIGGVDEATLEQVLAAGARRAVVVRVLTEAPDPGAVAARLAAALAANRTV